MSDHTTTAPRVACIYARVSTSDQADRGYSLPTQIEACQHVAAKHGYTVPESFIFTDDVTGTTLQRPSLAAVRDLVRQRAITAIVVHDIDRLSRKLAHQLLLTEEFAQAGVRLHICLLPTVDDSPESQMLVQIRGSVAEYERLKILERTHRGRRGRAQAGFPTGGRRTLGIARCHGQTRVVTV